MSSSLKKPGTSLPFPPLQSSIPSRDEKEPLRTSVRYDKIWTVLEKVLQQSRQRVLAHPDLLTSLYYEEPEDITALGGKEVLVPVIAALLDKMHEQIKEELSKHMEQTQVEEQLLQLEALIHDWDTENTLRREIDEMDKELTELELMQTNRLAEEEAHAEQLPQTIWRTATYQKLVQERQHLQEQVAALELQLASGEKANQESSSMMQLQQLAMELDRSADVSSMVDAATMV